MSALHGVTPNHTRFDLCFHVKGLFVLLEELRRAPGGRLPSVQRADPYHIVDANKFCYV